MPVLVTDDDVLQQIGINDDEAASIATQVQVIAPDAVSLPGWTDSLSAWTTDLNSWRTWAGEAKTRLSGGVLTGEWFGVVADGDAAIAWKQQLDKWQQTFASYAKGTTPAAPVPSPLPSVSSVGDQNNQNVATGVTNALGAAGKALSGPLALIAVAAAAIAVAVVAKELGKR